MRPHHLRYESKQDVNYINELHNLCTNSRTSVDSKNWTRDSYKPKSKINYPKSKVRFSIPIITSDIDEDLDFISERNSPSKIVFPNEGDTFNNDDEIKDEQNGFSTEMKINDFNESLPPIDTVKILSGHLVDMPSKVMINVQEEISSYSDRNINLHSNKISTTTPQSYHQRAHSTDVFNLNRPSKTISHNRSKSLQSVIADTLVQHKKNLDGSRTNQNSSQSNNVLQNSTFKLSKIQLTNGLTNIPSMKPPSSPSKLYLTTDSPINKQTVPIPLEIELPPFLSPVNKNKKRSSLIYDGDSYKVYNEDDDSGINDLSLSESSMELLDESNSLNSIPSATFNISFDVNTNDPDKLLGIDEGANVNLKVQNKNLRKPKILLLPKLPFVNKNSERQENENINTSGANSQLSGYKNNFLRLDETVNEQILNIADKEKPYTLNTFSGETKVVGKDSQNGDNKTDRFARFEDDVKRNITVPRLDLTEFDSLDSITSVITINSTKDDISPTNLHATTMQTPNFSSAYDNQSPLVTNESLKILATPSKSITIPDLSRLEFNTPKEERSTLNGALTFFDRFESSNNNDEILQDSSTVNTVQKSTPGTLNSEFKFPSLNNEQREDKEDSSNKNDEDLVENDSDYQKINRNSRDFEERRLKLVSNSLHQTNGFRHAHKRSKSIYNTDELMSTPIKSCLTFSPQINATSTPPQIPERSSLRFRTPPHMYQQNPNYDFVSSSNRRKVDVVESHPSSERQHNTNYLSPQIEFKRKPKPLSSFQSFPHQVCGSIIETQSVKNEDFMKDKLNLLSPRRQLSNSDSQQQSVTNSQFSTATKETELTAITQTVNDFDVPMKKVNFPDIGNNNDEIEDSLRAKKTQKTDGFNIIKERQKDGKIIDVILLDDDSLTETGNTQIRDLNKKPFKKRENKSESRQQLISEYQDILNMCEQTAMSAKQTIYQLAGVTKNSSNTPAS